MEAALEFRDIDGARIRRRAGGEREGRGVAGGLAERGPDGLEAQGAEADVTALIKEKNELVAEVKNDGGVAAGQIVAWLRAHRGASVNAVAGASVAHHLPAPVHAVLVVR